MTDFELAIYRLQKQNRSLLMACVALVMVSYLLYTIADRPRINLYEDFSLQYSPGLWSSNEESIYVYYSQHLNSLAIGYFDKKGERLIDLAWILHVESEGEAIRQHQPLTPEERERLLEEMGFKE
jgi:hypothetical protein